MYKYIFFIAILSIFDFFLLRHKYTHIFKRLLLFFLFQDHEIPTESLIKLSYNIYTTMYKSFFFLRYPIIANCIVQESYACRKKKLKIKPNTRQSLFIVQTYTQIQHYTYIHLLDNLIRIYVTTNHKIKIIYFPQLLIKPVRIIIIHIVVSGNRVVRLLYV